MVFSMRIKFKPVEYVKSLVECALLPSGCVLNSLGDSVIAVELLMKID